MKRLAWLLPLLFVAAVTAAPPSLPEQGATALSTFLKGATDRGDVPGVVVAVVDKNGVLYNEAFGQSSTLSKKAMTKDTIFNMASMTKPVTSIAIMMLVDEGKLKIDDDVAKYLPKYKSPLVISKFNEADASYETRPAKRPITIRHLLTHTSGIGYGFSSPTLTKIMAKTKQTELDLPLLFDPGESWAYGASTRVLGHVVEAISGQKIDVFLQSRILGPLGMNDTSYLVPATKYSRVVAVNARGTDGKFEERPMPATLPATVQGDGGLYGTASDYGLFLRMLLNRGTLNGKRILSESVGEDDLREPDGQRGGTAAGVRESVALEELPAGCRQGSLGTRLPARRREAGEPAHSGERDVGRYLQHTFLHRSEPGDRRHRDDADAAVL